MNAYITIKNMIPNKPEYGTYQMITHVWQVEYEMWHGDTKRQVRYFDDFEAVSRFIEGEINQ